MSQMNEPYFPSDFILDYIRNDAGAERFLTYTIFRVLSFTAKKERELPSLIKEKLSCSYCAEHFSDIEDFLMGDYYFSPTLEKDSFDPLFLYDAIYMVKHASEYCCPVMDELIISYYPEAAGISYTSPELMLSSLLTDEGAFYAALYLAVSRYHTSLADILPRFTDGYRKEFRFTCEDFILFDFMDEYFEQKNCRIHPSFIELTDTLVAATLGYYRTDFGTLLETEIRQDLNGTAARFAGMKRYGTIKLPAPANQEKACHMLAELFRYSALYELRNHLFDFHLEDDNLITLENWKEKLRWHYVQYANVYQAALDAYYTASLSRELLQKQFLENIDSFCSD